MVSTSISLESLQFLLQHMDANRRFELYVRCPSLREFEKSVPLKINSLVFDENQVIVNDTAYILGIIRKYNVGEARGFFARMNDYGGIAHEVDKYGIEDELDAYTITPGDVVLSQLREPRVQDQDSQIRSLENRILVYENRKARELNEIRPNRRMIENAESLMDTARIRLFDHQCRRDNIPPHFENLLQLTKSRFVDGQEQNAIERYVHNMKFTAAVKQFTTMLFGGRNSPIHVTKLGIIDTCSVIRLPFDLKFHVEQLMFHGDAGATLAGLAPILHESSFPLKKLDMEKFEMNDAPYPIVETARTLRIRHFLDHPLTVPSIKNPSVHVTFYGMYMYMFEELLEKWLESQRPIGTEYIIDIVHQENFVDEMEDVLKRLKAIPIDDENVIIPMSDSIQLKLSHGPFPEFAPNSQWAVKLSNEPAEQ